MNKRMVCRNVFCSGMSTIVIILLLIFAQGCSMFAEDSELYDEESSKRAENELYKEAVEAYDDELYSAAKELFSDLLQKYPTSQYALVAELKIADSLFSLGDYPAAYSAYEEFLRLHPKNKSAPWALYQLGNTQFKRYQGVKKDQSPLHNAIKAYKRLEKEYPQSEFNSSARRQIEQCRELLATHELEVAQFYFKQGKTEAGTRRYLDIAKTYGDTTAFQTAKESILQNVVDQNELIKLAKSKKDKNLNPQKAQALLPQQPVVISQSKSSSSTSSNKTDYNRARMTELNSSKLKAEIEHLRSLSCYQQEKLAIFAVETSTPFTVINNSKAKQDLSKDSRYKPTRLLLLPTDQKNLRMDALANLRLAKKIAPTKKCRSKNQLAAASEYVISLDSLEKNQSINLIEIKLEIPHTELPRIIHLDRPFRAVIISKDFRE